MYLFYVSVYALIAFLNAVKGEVSFCSNYVHQDCKSFKNSPDIKCQYFDNSLNCLKNVTDNGITFALIKPELALLASQLYNESYVVAELRNNNDYNSKTDFDLVVLVKDANIKYLGDLKGKKLCHPANVKSAKRLYNTIDMALVDPLECQSDNPSIIHRVVSAMDSFFGDSCRPGRWIDNDKMDAGLKHAHKSLCQLCVNQTCDYTDTKDPFESAMECFDNSGDVVITTLKLAKERNNSLYLQRNSVVSKEPFIWMSEGWPVVITTRQSIDDVKKFFAQSTLQSELLLQGGQKFFMLQQEKSILQYVKDLNLLPEKSKCPETLAWCTSSNVEGAQCDILKAALYTQGVLPELKCVNQPDGFSCLDSIKNNESDIGTFSNNLGYFIRRDYLRPVAFPSGETKSLVVIKDGQNLTSFEDLKSKFGCFAEFGDVSFMAFLKTLEAAKLTVKSNVTGVLMDSYLGGSCVPGIIIGDYDKVGASDFMKYCQCQGSPNAKTATICSADAYNDYYGNKGAMKCLEEIGNYAVVTTEGIEDILAQPDYSILCKNGTLLSSTVKPDDDCYLAITVKSEIAIKRNDPKLKDVVLMLLDLENDLEKDLGIKSSVKDLVYKGSGLSLHFDEEDDVRVKNFLDLYTGFNDYVQKTFITNAGSGVVGCYLLVAVLVVGILGGC